MIKTKNPPSTKGGIIINYQNAVKSADTHLLAAASKLYGLDGYEFSAINAHGGGRNLVYNCVKGEETKKILRISFLSDRSKEDFLAETEYIRYLHDNGSSVANVIGSLQGNLVEEITYNGSVFFVVLFDKAKDKMFWENGYKYREGVSITEYYYNCGKVLGKIHQLSKEYKPKHKRYDFFDKFNTGYINKLIPDSYSLLKMKMTALIKVLEGLEKNRETFGMIHFDFNDGNYFIDFDTGQITVYDFDNSCYCWYLFDLASVWGNGTGWIQHEKSAEKRKEFMDEYFKIVLDGYKSETAISDTVLDDLPIFFKANLVEGIVSHFECLRDGDNDGIEEEWVTNAIKCLEEDIPYKGFYHEI